MHAHALPLPTQSDLLARARDWLKGIILMAVTHVTALRNVLADAVDNYINTTGSTDAGGDLVIRASTTILVTFPFGNPAFGAASGGVITLNGTPIAATASAAGTADNALLRDRDNAQALACSVTGVGGGGDIEVSNTNIASGQDCPLDNLTYTAPV